MNGEGFLKDRNIMNVSMDGLRRQGLAAYNSLIETLNYSLKNGIIQVDKSSIESELETLRNVLGTLAASYQEGKDGWEPIEDYYIDSLNIE